MDMKNSKYTLKKCSEIYEELQERYGRLLSPFVKVFNEFKELYSGLHLSSFEVNILFKSFAVDYLPVRSDFEPAPSLSGQARKPRDEVNNYSEIVRVLDISDKTANKYAEI
jgi:hypothetical protein